jgi:mannose-6-phosphate isomerase-like protein (cupin superfamily)
MNVKTMDRREALGLLAAGAMISLSAVAQTAAASTSTEVKFFKYSTMPVTHNATNGSSGKNVPQELIPLGNVTGLHYTTVEPGKEFGPMRKGTLCEIRLVWEGEMEVLVEGMPSQTAEAGDIVVAPAGATYHVRNPADKPLTYLILQIKPEAKA